MISREVICSQYSSCLSCPLSSSLTGTDCRSLTQAELYNIMIFVRTLEGLPIMFRLSSLERLRGERKMYINNQWLEEPEIKSYIEELKEVLRLAVHDLKRANFGNCSTCAYSIENTGVKCSLDCKYEWRYAERVYKLLGGDDN